MQNPFVGSLMVSVVTTLLLLGSGSFACAQTAPGGVRPDAAARIAAAAALPTPRLKNDRPDLSGYWQPATGPGGTGGVYGAVKQPDASGQISVFPETSSVAAVNARMRAAVAKRRADTSLRPKYREPYAAKAMENFDAGDLVDPTYGCQLPGVARLGLPSEIFQTTDAVVLLYADLVNRYRVVPTDGRKRDPDADALVMGHPIGRWEGETLVVETSGFTDETWIDDDGSFHSEGLKLTERFTRKGNVLEYEAIAEDPIFLEPFKLRSQQLLLAPPGTHVLEEYPCVERSLDNMTNSETH
jgi:hypothetical protein